MLTLQPEILTMSRKRVFYIGFFSILVIGFFFTMSALIPGYSKPRVKVISEVQPFAFKDQNGRTVAENVLTDKVSLVNFFFTTCTSICPEMNGNLKPVFEKWKSEPRFQILSHTSDPERDSVPVLKAYAQKMGVDHPQWLFLTGRKDSLYAAARHSYAIDNPKNFVRAAEDAFLHTQFVALVNGKGQVMKIYDGLRPSELASIDADIQKILNQ